MRWLAFCRLTWHRVILIEVGRRAAIFASIASMKASAGCILAKQPKAMPGWCFIDFSVFISLQQRCAACCIRDRRTRHAYVVQFGAVFNSFEWSSSVKHVRRCSRFCKKALCHSRERTIHQEVVGLGFVFLRSLSLRQLCALSRGGRGWITRSGAG